MLYMAHKWDMGTGGQACGSPDEANKINLQQRCPWGRWQCGGNIELGNHKFWLNTESQQAIICSDFSQCVLEHFIQSSSCSKASGWACHLLSPSACSLNGSFSWSDEYFRTVCDLLIFTAVICQVKQAETRLNNNPMRVKAVIITRLSRILDSHLTIAVLSTPVF